MDTALAPKSGEVRGGIFEEQALMIRSLGVISTFPLREEMQSLQVGSTDLAKLLNNQGRYNNLPPSPLRRLLKASQVAFTGYFR